MNTKRNLLLAFALTLLAACSSAPTHHQTEYAEDRVVSRSDSLSARPSWVSETKSTAEDGENTLFIGMAEVPGDSRTQAAFKASDAAARGNLANKVKTNITKIVQSSDSGFSMDDQQLNSMIQEVSQMSLQGVDVKDRYWEKVVHTQSSGSEVLTLKAFSLISIPKDEVKKMIMSAVDKAPDDKAAHGKFKSLLDSKWNEIPAE